MSARHDGLCMVFSMAFGVAVLLQCQASKAQTADVAAAQQQFVTSCGVCHSVKPGDTPRQGPNLSGIYGRSAGTLQGFAYSPALKDAGWTWDEARLDPWIANAQAVRPGTVMNYRQADPAKRQLIITYLKTLTPNL